MSDTLVARVRRFNRFYTRTIGLLNETLTRSAFTLTEARVLFELGAGQETASDIATELILDPAYLARVIEKFRRQGLVCVRPAQDDRRRKILSLTDDGRNELARLQAAAEREVESLIAPLNAEVRGRLGVAMTDIEDILSPVSQPQREAPFLLRPHRIGDVGWVIERQARLYADEYGWSGAFEALLCEIGGKFITGQKPGRDFCWIAERDGERLGAVFLVAREDGNGQLRMLHVERSARGQGVGSMLVERCVEQARETGYPRLMLWTNDILHSARHIYERFGFRLVEENRHHSFGKDLVGQNWELEL